MTTTTRVLLLAIGLQFSAITSVGQASYVQELKQVSIQLYNSFDKIQNISGRLAFDDTSRLIWNNLPIGLRARKGTSIGNMNEDQRRLLHRVLSVSLSSQGYLKATSIMHLDDLLNRFADSIYQSKDIDEETHLFLRSLLWSHNNFYFAFFGNPNEKVWGFKLEGHHLSINFTIADDKIMTTPYFMGSDPAEYPITEYAGWRVLGQEEDMGLKFIHLLTPAQQKKATMNVAVPEDIITSAESGKRLVDNWGIRGAELTPAQKNVLQYIIREYVFNLEYEKAVAEYDKILKAGIDNIYFGWIGEYDERKPHYFVLNGPTFIIEFDNNGGPRGSANHIHTIWREKGNEYGEDVLKKHYSSEKH